MSERNQMVNECIIEQGEPGYMNINQMIVKLTDVHHCQDFLLRMIGLLRPPLGETLSSLI